MAQVYGPPEGFDPPTFDDYFVNGKYDMQQSDKIDKEYLDRLRNWCKENGSGDLVGEVIRFQVADGYATYMVYTHRPLTLIHVPLHDAYSIPDAHARGLNVTDVRKQVERERTLNDLFGRKND